MKLARITAWLLAIGTLLGASSLACAEEITLKDGQKIVGTIVGYEKDMFRVETDFGIALIRKDKVVSIEVGKPPTAAPAIPPTAEKKPVELKPTQPTVLPANSPTTPEPPRVPPVQASASAKPTPGFTPVATPFPGPALMPSKPSEAKPVTPTPVVVPPVPSSAIVAAPPDVPNSDFGRPQLSPAALAVRPLESAPISVAPPPPPVVVKLPAPPSPPRSPPPPPVSRPIDVPLPSHLEEHLDGNTYFNDTFHFSMYKPPDWKIFEGLTKETGTGIMAMGTDDEQTVLIVDRRVWSGTPRLSNDEVESKFRQTYQDYQQLSREPAQCAGQAATRTRFTGFLDGVEWHGVTVHMIRGNMVFGITGVTSAETFGFQEAIFNKIVNSVNFLPPAEPATASQKP